MESHQAAPTGSHHERMPHAVASRILHDLWSRKQVEMNQAEPEARAASHREVEALSLAITALELLPD